MITRRRTVRHLGPKSSLTCGLQLTKAASSRMTRTSCGKSSLQGRRTTPATQGTNPLGSEQDWQPQQPLLMLRLAGCGGAVWCTRRRQLRCAPVYEPEWLRLTVCAPQLGTLARCPAGCRDPHPKYTLMQWRGSCRRASAAEQDTRTCSHLQTRHD